MFAASFGKASNGLRDGRARVRGSAVRQPGRPPIDVAGGTDEAPSRFGGLSDGSSHDPIVQKSSTVSSIGIGGDGNWWRTAVVYQVYPRSFADANGDGIGDVAGVRSREDVQELGIDAIWLSPFYPSPLADGGYDITDYRDIDPRLGTLGDFDALVRDAHGRGIRIIIDIVPNHTSNQHPWFRAALDADPGSSERDRYIFRDGTGPDGRGLHRTGSPISAEAAGNKPPTDSGIATCSLANYPT